MFFLQNGLNGLKPEPKFDEKQILRPRVALIKSASRNPIRRLCLRAKRSNPFHPPASDQQIASLRSQCP